jgi:polar amino acid transport system permease protein
MAGTAVRQNDGRSRGGLLANDTLIKRIGEIVAFGFFAAVVGILGVILFRELDVELLITIFPRFVEAFVLVLQIVVISSVASVSLGALVGLGRISSSSITSSITGMYVEFFRGTPLLFQLIVIYYGVPGLWPTGAFPFTDFKVPAAIIGLTLNHGAYAGEAFRGGINAVAEGQLEAARSLGMSRVQAMREVVLPQAWRNALPALGNDQIILVKDTSLLTVIAVDEFIQVLRSVQSSSLDVWTPAVWTCLFYLSITLSLSALVSYLHSRADWSDESASRISDVLGLLDDRGVRR